MDDDSGKLYGDEDEFDGAVLDNALAEEDEDGSKILDPGALPKSEKTQGEKI